MSGKPGMNRLVYTVYRNKGDELLILDGSARECAKAMGMALTSFYTTVTRCHNGENKKYYIESNEKENENAD